MEKIFFSNNLDCHFHILRQNLFEDRSFSLRRVIIVPSLHQKNFLMEKFAKDKELEGIMFLKFIEIKHLSSFILDFFDSKKKIPNFLELNLTIESKLSGMIESYFFPEKNAEINNVLDVDSLIRYLQISDHKTSKKSKRRISSLIDFLTPLFYMYMVFQKELDLNFESIKNWQLFLFKEVEKQYLNLQEELVKPVSPSLPYPIQLHLFNLSFLPHIYREALAKLPFEVSHYVLSPCKYFWEDISTEREKAYILKKIEKGKKIKTFQTEDYLFGQENFLLANLGKIQRQNLKILNDREIESFECYVKSEERWLDEEWWKNFSLLMAIKQDFLHLRNIESSKARSIKKEKSSIQIHEAVSKIRELEVLYDYIVQVLSENKDIRASDIKVYAPDIKEYLPFIHFIFGGSEAPIDYKIFDLDNVQNSFFSQGLINFLSLYKSRWEKKDIIDIFENPSFMKKQNFSKADILKIKSWVEKANISWGKDSLHRQKILNEKILPDLHVNSWQHGLDRIICSFVFDRSLPDILPIVPIDDINFSDIEVFDKFLSLFTEIEKDIEYLEGDPKKNIEEWARYLNKIADKYFSFDENQISESLSFQTFSKFIDKLLTFGKSCEATFEFSSIFKNLKRALKKDLSSFQSNRTQAVSFYSLKEDVLPSKVICAIGLNEDFPRKESANFYSLLFDRVKNYVPSNVDKDRNLFLNILLLAESKVFFSYLGICPFDGRKKLPSSLIREFCLYIDQAFNMSDEKISDFIFFKHPALSFDKKYFQKQLDHHFLFSPHRFKAAKKYYLEKGDCYSFIRSFDERPEFKSKVKDLPANIELKKLASLAANPLKFYLNEVLQIYLEKKHEDHDSKDLILSYLDQYLIRKNVVKKRLDFIVDRLEKEGNFPVGICKEISKDKIKLQAMMILSNLKNFKIEPDQIISANLSLSTEAYVKRQSLNELILPHVECFVEDTRVNITGSLENISEKGLIVFTDDKFENILKVWPEFLVYLKIKDQIFENASPSLLFLKNGKILTFDKIDVERSLSLYLSYFRVCLTFLSPLIREWSSALLIKDADEFERAFKRSFSDQKLFEDPYFTWAFARFDTNFSSDKIYNNWSEFLKTTFEDVLKNLKTFSPKGG